MYTRDLLIALTVLTKISTGENDPLTHRERNRIATAQLLIIRELDRNDQSGDPSTRPINGHSVLADIAF